MNINIIKWCKSNLPFLILLLIFFGFSFDTILHRPPTGQHIWRQTDCLSITQQYAEGAPFFEPQMHIQLADKNTSGKTAGEFPILYYIVGKIWSAIGQSTLSFRLFYLLILTCGVFALFKTLSLVLKNQFWSIALTFLLISSPLYIFYSVGFLTDAPAYSFVLIALFYFTYYSIHQTKRHLYFAILFFSLAGLIKVSSLIAFIFIGFIYFLEFLPIATLGTRKLFRNRKFESLLIILVPIFVLSWYVYASFYNELHTFKYTFNNVYPLWIMGEDELNTVTHRVITFASHFFYSRALLYFIAIICLYNLFSWRKINAFAYTANLIILIGSIAYFVLWAPLMGQHDYYYNALLILIPAIVIPFIWNIKTNYLKVFNSAILKVTFSCFVFYNLWYCASAVRLKGESNIANHLVLGRTNNFVGETIWYNWHNGTNFNRLIELQPKLESLNIKKSDKIVVIPDYSFNTTLYYLNRKGWTNFKSYSKSSEIDLLISKGAKYLFILDEEYTKKKYLEPFLDNEIYTYKGVRIFKL